MLRKVSVNSIMVLIVMATLVLPFILAGCGSGSASMPTFISFIGDSSESAKEMKPVVEELMEEYEGKVKFEEYDYDDPANKDVIAKYHVTMNPTFIVLNTEGKIKETFMGKAHKDMLLRSIETYIPRDEKTQSTIPSSQDQPMTIPQSDSQSSVPFTPVPGQ